MGQGVEPPPLQATGHEIIPSSLWGAFDQDRGLDLDKAPGIEEIADEFDYAMAQQYVFPHSRPPQVEIAILEAHHLLNLSFFIYVKWRCLAPIEERDFLSDELDLTAG